MNIRENEIVLEYTFSGFYEGGMFAGHNYALLRENKVEDYRLGLASSDMEERQKTAINVLSTVHEPELKIVASLIKPDTDIFSQLPEFNIDAIVETNTLSGTITPNQSLRIQDFYGDFTFKISNMTMKCLIYKVTGDEYRKTCCRYRVFDVIEYSAKIS